MLYGGMELQYFQLTPMGVSRMQSGQIPTRLHPETKRVMGMLAKFGGTAEWDELKAMSGVNPSVLSTVLKRLMDLGYVTSGAPQQAAPVK